MDDIRLEELNDHPELSRLLTFFGEAGGCWYASVRPDGRVHLAPIWQVWLAPFLYVVTQPTTVRARNLATNPSVSLSLADTDNAFIIEGVARFAPEMRDHLQPLYHAKYGWDINADADYDAVIQIRPNKVLAWGTIGEGRWIIL